jgi:enterochelin esterase-like enzyme
VIARRQLLAALLAAGCSRRERTEPPATSLAPTPSATPAPSDRGGVRTLTWELPERQRAVVLVPAWGGDGARFPVLVALHGRGEAVKGPERGAWGWARDYSLVRAIERVCAPPLTQDDLQGFADPERLERLNRELEARPFGGLVVVCPWVPDLDLRSDAALRAYGRFVIETLLPRVYRETPAIGTPAATGIDGVSLGGAVALRVGLGNPAAFGAVGALQPAIRDDQASAWVEIAKAARATRPTLKLRLLTSTEDYYRPAVERTADALQKAGVDHELTIVPGPHDYVFNRGPGSVELLLFHDRALRA